MRTFAEGELLGGITLQEFANHRLGRGLLVGGDPYLSAFDTVGIRPGILSLDGGGLVSFPAYTHEFPLRYSTAVRWCAVFWDRSAGALDYDWGSTMPELTDIMEEDVPLCVALQPQIGGGDMTVYDLTLPYAFGRPAWREDFPYDTATTRWTGTFGGGAHTIENNTCLRVTSGISTAYMRTLGTAQSWRESPLLLRARVRFGSTTGLQKFGFTDYGATPYFSTEDFFCIENDNSAVLYLTARNSGVETSVNIGTADTLWHTFDLFRVGDATTRVVCAYIDGVYAGVVTTNVPTTTDFLALGVTVTLDFASPGDIHLAWLEVIS